MPEGFPGGGAMGLIRELPASVINQIAAGEVVERPASVVKELLENAVDAGASRVDLGVERGGKDLVRVADDGKGMDREDLPLAFRPHATSKLAVADDLHAIRTLGFRGEALAAIAEISKVRCQTRTAGAAHGSELVIEGGEAAPIRDCGCAPGTVIEVRNLFFNTPVRRTFLKSDSTEAGHVAEAFIRVALAHPGVHFTYRSGGKTVYDLPASDGLKERIGSFFGRDLADSLLWVESEVDTAKLWGYVAHPSQNRSSGRGQYFFVGGRYIRDRSLGHALGEAYRGLIMVGRQPVAFLYLDLDPVEVDVNVHPTKIEVRFRDGHRVYSQLLGTLRQSFLASDLHTRLQVPVEPEAPPAAFPPPAAPEPLAMRAPGEVESVLSSRPIERQTVASWFTPSSPSPSRPSGGYAPAPSAPSWSDRLERIVPDRPGDGFDEFVGEGAEPVAPPASVRAVAPAPPPAEPARAAVPGRSRARAARALQVHDSYLVAETEDGVVLIDQHALHERILYEELKRRVEEGGVESQRLLVPEPVELPPSEAAEILQRGEALARLGLGVEEFGGGTLLVTSVPALLGDVAPGRLVRDLAAGLRDQPVAPSPQAMFEEVLSMVACKAAVKAGQTLSQEEVDALLERRHLVDNSHHCPHGRPTALTFSRSELERQFGRI
jgi:DNA mismatch repair protein MutL